MERRRFHKTLNFAAIGGGTSSSTIALISLSELNESRRISPLVDSAFETQISRTAPSDVYLRFVMPDRTSQDVTEHNKERQSTS